MGLEFHVNSTVVDEGALAKKIKTLKNKKFPTSLLKIHLSESNLNSLIHGLSIWLLESTPQKLTSFKV